MNQYFGYIRVSTIKQGELGVSLQQQKEAIELHYRHGRTIAEAAEIMEADFDAVQTWIRRGRDRLREILVIENDGHIEVQRLRYLLESMYAIAG